jgi:hypothetical protein
MTHHDDYYDCAILAVGFGIEKGARRQAAK